MQSRNLAVISTMQRIADVVIQTVGSLRRIKDSQQLADILRKEQDVAENITEAAQESAGDVQDIIVLALELYESMHRNERSVGRAAPKPLEAIETHDDLIAHARAIIEESE